MDSCPALNESGRMVRWFGTLIVLCAATAHAIAQVPPGCSEWWLVGPPAPPGGALTCAVTWDPDGAGPATDQLVVGGSFGVAAWDGTTWSTLGATALAGVVHTVTTYNGKLIAAGDFTSIGGVTAKAIASWDGTVWTPLSSGIVGNPASCFVTALETFENRLIAGGFFTHAGGVPCNNIAAWDGQSWSSLGTGITTSGSYLGVYALTNHGGELIVGGAFQFAGSTPASCIAAWNGSAWTALGAGFSNPGFGESIGPVNALRVFNGQLIAGGSFSRSGSTVVNAVAAWNGTSWIPLGEGLSMSAPSATWPFALALKPMGPRLFVAGIFTAAGATSSRYISAWNGVQWSALRSGLGDQTNGLVEYQGELIAVGSSSTAGGRESPNLARWGCCYADADGNGLISVDDLFLYLNRWFTADAAADINGHAGISVDDLFYFLDRWFTGC